MPHQVHMSHREFVIRFWIYNIHKEEFLLFFKNKFVGKFWCHSILSMFLQQVYFTPERVKDNVLKMKQKRKIEFKKNPRETFQAK